MKKAKKMKKHFDCVEMKRRIQAEIYQEIKDLTPAEEIEYFRRQAETGPLGKWWKSIQKAQASPTPRSRPSRSRRVGG